MNRASFCILFLLAYANSFSQTFDTNYNQQQEKSYEDFFVLAMNSWCGVFTGHNALDPCYYHPDTAVKLTGFDYLKSQHLKLLRSAVRCKSNQNLIKSIEFLLDSELIPDNEKLPLYQYALSCYKLTGTKEKEAKLLKKRLKKLIGKEEYSQVLLELDDSKTKEKSYQELIHGINLTIRTYKTLESKQ